MIEVLCTGQLVADILARPVDKLDFEDDTRLIEERTFFYSGGANDQFSLEDIDQSQFNEAALVHVGGTYLLPGFDGEGAARLFREARYAGKLTSMDVTWDTRGLWRKTIWDLGECASLACAVAALNIQCIGATEGNPTFERAAHFIERAKDG
jgi:sugar/nucleoside kinase (ribokinase family)